MEKIIADFAGDLKKAGLNISISEITDALKALATFGISEEKNFYHILKATMLKDENDREIFDLVYNLHFKANTSSPQYSLPQSSCHKGDIPLKGTAGMSDKAKSFYGAILNQDNEAIAAAVEEAIDNTDLSTLNLEELLRQAKVTLSWFMIDNALALNDRSEEREALKKLEKDLRFTIAQKAAAEIDTAAETILADENLWEKDFDALSAEQIKAMEKKIEKLGRKLGSRYSYRLHPGKRGIINMRKVLAETAKRGYPTDKMHYLTKIRNKPSLIILCDISGSMAQFSSFFLQLVYAMEKRFQDIQSYLFIDNIVEAKFPRQSNNPGSAIAAAILEAYVPRTGRTDQHCTTTGVSDYGKAFHHFLAKFGDVLNTGKTVLILGDAKNNWFPSNKENIRAIKEKSKEIIWLNPQPRETWDKEDSVIGDYAPYCKTVKECRNLRQLTEIAETLK